MWENLSQRIHAMRDQIREREREIATLEQECARYEKDLAGFEARYNRIVKPIALQVEAVQQTIEKLRKLQLDQMMGNGVSVDSLWRERHQQAATDVPMLDDDSFMSAKKPQEDRTSKLKQLYRKLARRFHPDLAADDADRQRRHRMMSQINNAHQEGDVELLEALEEATPEDEKMVVDEFVPMAVMLLRKLQREYDDLEDRILDLQKRRHHLRYGHLMELKLQESLVGRQGNYFLKSIADDLQEQYWKYVKELDELRRKMK